MKRTTASTQRRGGASATPVVHAASGDQTKEANSSTAVTLKQDTLPLANVNDGNSNTARALSAAVASLEIDPRAKSELVRQRVAEFAETVAVKLRRRVADDRARLHLLRAEASGRDSAAAAPNSVWGVFQSVAGAQLSAAAIAQGMLFYQFGVKGALSVLGMSLLQKLGENSFRALRMRRLEALLGYFGALGTTDGSDVESERLIREVAAMLAWRHADHVVRLSTRGQYALADVMVRRIRSNLRRGQTSYRGESRAPAVAAVQRTLQTVSVAWNKALVPADKLLTAPPLSLVDRVVRALTFECLEGDDTTVLELDSLLVPPQASAQGGGGRAAMWTAHGVLSKCGVRVALPQAQGGGNAHFAHEGTDVFMYGFAWGTEEEARDRGMTRVDSPAPGTQGAGNAVASRIAKWRASKL